MAERATFGCIAVAALVIGPGTAFAQSTTPFADAHEAPPSGWTRPVFKLSQDYPTTKPAAEARPWKTIDYKTKPAEYLKAVLDYCYEGNIDVDFRRQAPHALAALGDQGRCFLHSNSRG